MTKTKMCEDCPYHELYAAFALRVHEALKSAVKKWQKENNEPLPWPDTIWLIKWLTRRAK